jgi:hypothetical protein
VRSNYTFGWAELVLPPLATALPQLRVLRVHLGLATRVVGADLRALGALAQLEALELSEGNGRLVEADDLANMLRPLHRLRTLVLWFMMAQLVDTALRIVGAASPQLRHVACFAKLALEDAGEPAEAAEAAHATAMFFPRLEYLHAGILEVDGIDQAR